MTDHYADFKEDIADLGEHKLKDLSRELAESSRTLRGEQQDIAVQQGLIVQQRLIDLTTTDNGPESLMAGLQDSNPAAAEAMERTIKLTALRESVAAMQAKAADPDIATRAKPTPEALKAAVDALELAESTPTDLAAADTAAKMERMPGRFHNPAGQAA